MTNKPMLSVERDLIERAVQAIINTSQMQPALNELRALLDKPSYPNRLCHADHNAHPYICGCLKGDEEAQRRFDEHHGKTAQPHGEPVAYLYGLDRLKNQHVVGCAASLSKNPGKGFVAIFAEQPAPVAVVMPERLNPAELDELEVIEVLLSSQGLSNLAGTMAAARQFIDEVNRLNGVKP